MRNLAKFILFASILTAFFLVARADNSQTAKAPTVKAIPPPAAKATPPPAAKATTTTAKSTTPPPTKKAPSVRGKAHTPGAGVAASVWAKAAQTSTTKPSASPPTTTLTRNKSVALSGKSGKGRAKSSDEDVLVEELWTVANLAQVIPFEKLETYPNSKKFCEKEGYFGQFVSEKDLRVKTLAYLRLAVKKLSGKLNDLNEVRLQFLAAAMESPVYFENGYVNNYRADGLLQRINGYKDDVKKLPKMIAETSGFYAERGPPLLAVVSRVLVNLKEADRQMLFLRMVLCMMANARDAKLISALKILGIDYCEDENSVALEIWQTTTPGAQFGFLSAGPEAQKFAARHPNISPKETVALAVELYKRPISDGARARLAFLQGATASHILRENLAQTNLLNLVMYNSMYLPSHQHLDWIFHNLNAVSAHNHGASGGGPPPSQIPTPQTWRFLAESFAFLQNDNPPVGELAHRRAQLICVCSALSKGLRHTDLEVVDSALRTLGATSCEIFDNMIEVFWNEPFAVAPSAGQISEITDSVELPIAPLATAAADATADETRYLLVLAAISDRPIADENRLRIVFMTLAMRFAIFFKTTNQSTTKTYMTSVLKQIAEVKKHSPKSALVKETPQQPSLSARIRALLAEKRGAKRDAKEYVGALEKLIGHYTQSNASEWDAFEAVIHSSFGRKAGGLRLKLARKLKKFGNSIEAALPGI